MQVKDGIAVFDNLLINITGRYTMRFLTQIPGSDSKLVHEAEYDTFVDSLRLIRIIESPDNMGLGTLGVARLYVENAIGQPVQDWDCEKHKCVTSDGQFAVESVLLQSNGIDPYETNLNDGTEVEPGVLEFGFVPNSTVSGTFFSFTASFVSGCGAGPEARKLEENSESFDVLSTEPDYLRLAVSPPESLKAGQEFQMIVEAIDRAGNVINAALDFHLALLDDATGQSAEGDIFQRCGDPFLEEGVCQGTASKYGVRGPASFNDLAIPRAGLYRVLVSLNEPWDTTVESGPILVEPEPLNAFTKAVFRTQPPLSGVAGQPLTPAPVVGIADQYGNPIPEDIEVSFASMMATDIAIPLADSPLITAENGLLTYNSLTMTFLDPNAALRGCITERRLKWSGGITVNGKRRDFFITSNQIDMMPGPADRIDVLVQPERSEVGAAGYPLLVNPVVQLSDFYGNAVCKDGLKVHVVQCRVPGDFSDCGGAVASGTIVYGSTTVKMTPSEIGEIRLGFVAKIPGEQGTVEVKGFSYPFTVLSGEAAGLVFDQAPTSSVADEVVHYTAGDCRACEPGALVLTVVDKFGNDALLLGEVEVRATLNCTDERASLVGETVRMVSGSSVVFPGLKVTMGAYTDITKIQCTYVLILNEENIISSLFDVWVVAEVAIRNAWGSNPLFPDAPLQALELVAGQPFVSDTGGPIEVELFAADGTLVEFSTRTVTVLLGKQGSAYPGLACEGDGCDEAVVSGGIAEFPLLNAVKADTGLNLVFDATAGLRLITVTSPPITVVHSTSNLSSLVLHTPPVAQISAGDSFSLEVTLADEYGNPHEEAGPMTVDASIDSIVSASDYQESSSSYNIFVLNLTIAGAYNLTVQSSLGVHPLVLQVEVLPGPTVELRWVTPPPLRARALERLPGPLPAVELLDAYGNRAVGSAEAGVVVQAMLVCPARRDLCSPRSTMLSSDSVWPYGATSCDELDGASSCTYSAMDGLVTLDFVFEEWGAVVLNASCCGMQPGEGLYADHQTVVGPHLDLEVDGMSETATAGAPLGGSALNLALVYASEGTPGHGLTFGPGDVASDAPQIPVGLVLEARFLVQSLSANGPESVMLRNVSLPHSESVSSTVLDGGAIQLRGLFVEIVGTYVLRFSTANFSSASEPNFFFREPFDFTSVSMVTEAFNVTPGNLDHLRVVRQPGDCVIRNRTCLVSRQPHVQGEDEFNNSVGGIKISAQLVSDEPMALSYGSVPCEDDLCMQQAAEWWAGGRAEFSNLTVLDVNASQAYIVFTSAHPTDEPANSTLFAVIDAEKLNVSLSRPVEGVRIVAGEPLPNITVVICDKFGLAILEPQVAPVALPAPRVAKCRLLAIPWLFFCADITGFDVIFSCSGDVSHRTRDSRRRRRARLDTSGARVR